MEITADTAYKMNNKKGVSLMVSYALLIVIAIGLSVGVYSYLKGFTPSDTPECPAETSLAIVSAKCSFFEQTLNVTLSNRGLFNVSAAYIRFRAEDERVPNQLNYGNETFPFSFSPNSPMISFTYNISSTLTSSGMYVLEIQPATLQDRKLFPCSNTVTQKVACNDYICGDAVCDIGEPCAADCNTEVYCDDGADNDEINGIDCLDLACSADPTCQPAVSCPPGHIDNCDGTCTASISDVLEDGHIIEAGFVRVNDAQNITIMGFPPQNIFGYIEWDTSSIPDSALIDDVSIEYNGILSPGGLPGNQFYNLTNARPSTSPNDTIFSLTAAKYNTGGPHIMVGQNTIDLSASASADLQSLLSANWFAAGIYSTAGVEVQISSSETGPATTPTLIVNYNLTGYDGGLCGGPPYSILEAQGSPFNESMAGDTFKFQTTGNSYMIENYISPTQIRIQGDLTTEDNTDLFVVQRFGQGVTFATYMQSPPNPPPTRHFLRNLTSIRIDMEEDSDQFIFESTGNNYTMIDFLNPNCPGQSMCIALEVSAPLNNLGEISGDSFIIEKSGQLSSIQLE